MIHIALYIVATVIVIVAVCYALAFMGAGLAVAGDLLNTGFDRACDWLGALCRRIGKLFQRRPPSGPAS